MKAKIAPRDPKFATTMVRLGSWDGIDRSTRFCSSCPDVPCMDYLPTLCEKEATFKRKWLGKYSHTWSIWDIFIHSY